jgi:hypothetical protein
MRGPYHRGDGGGDSEVLDNCLSEPANSLAIEKVFWQDKPPAHLLRLV